MQKHSSRSLKPISKVLVLQVCEILKTLTRLVFILDMEANLVPLPVLHETNSHVHNLQRYTGRITRFQSLDCGKVSRRFLGEEHMRTCNVPGAVKSMIR